MTSEKKPYEAKSWARVVRDSAPYLAMGTSLALTVLIGVLGGYWLDGKLGTRPIFFLVGSAFGLFAAGYQFYRTVSRTR